MQKTRMSEAKRLHVLAIIRKRLGISQKASLGYLGIPVRTCTALECGQVKRMRHATAKIISDATGVSVGSLLENSPDPQTITGKAFSAETFDAHKAGPRKVLSATEVFRFYLLLCIKLGRVLLAAFKSEATPFAVWEIRTALNTIGARYPEFEQQRQPGPFSEMTAPEAFDLGLQAEMSQAQDGESFWPVVLKRFIHQLNAIARERKRK